MSKYTIIGDLHCRPQWKQIVEKESDSDKIIFLGDYTCPRDIILKDPTDACGFLYEVLDFKDKHSDQVILLRGNHDNCSLGYYWARCYPQDHSNVQQYWQTDDVKNWFLKNTQWIYRIPDSNIICSHAGCSFKFLENAEKYLKRNKDMINPFKSDNRYNWIIDHLNYIEPCELFGFTGDYFDTYGDSETQPCTWIRPYTLVSCSPKDIVQVVGHTRFKNIINYKEEHIKEREIKDTLSDIWCCDALQYNKYLVIEDGEFKIMEI